MLLFFGLGKPTESAERRRDSLHAGSIAAFITVETRQSGAVIVREGVRRATGSMSSARAWPIAPKGVFSTKSSASAKALA